MRLGKICSFCPEQVEAKLSEGVLKLRILKSEGAQRRRIEITS